MLIKLKKFDDLFRFTLTISTLILSISLTLRVKELSAIFYIMYLTELIFVIAFCFLGHIQTYSYNEAFFKLFYWYILMFYTTTNSYLIGIGASDMFIAPLIGRILLTVLSFFLTYPIYLFFKNLLVKESLKSLLFIFLIITCVIPLIPEMIRFMADVFSS